MYECKDILSTDKTLANDSIFKEIQNIDRRGLKFPAIVVLSIIVHNFIVVQKIISQNFEEKFLRISNPTPDK